MRGAMVAVVWGIGATLRYYRASARHIAHNGRVLIPGAFLIAGVGLLANHWFVMPRGNSGYSPHARAADTEEITALTLPHDTP